MSRKKVKIIDLLEDYPVIPLIRNIELLDVALESPSKIIFWAVQSVFGIADKVEKCHKKNKFIFLYIDDIPEAYIGTEGLVYIKNHVCPDGILTETKELMRNCKSLGLFTIFRYEITSEMIEYSQWSDMECVCPDILEIIPGRYGHILYDISKKMTIPIISGGNIKNKGDVLYCLRNGALGVSTTKVSLWFT